LSWLHSLKSALNVILKFQVLITKRFSSECNGIKMAGRGMSRWTRRIRRGYSQIEKLH
jgi:hypothetical protein